MSTNLPESQRKFRIRRCDGNHKAWMLVTLDGQNREYDIPRTYTTNTSLDILLSYGITQLSPTCQPKPGDIIELIYDLP